DVGVSTAVFLTALVAAAVVVLAPAQVRADGSTVRYSYQQVELDGDAQWGLVPKPVEEELSGKLTNSKVFDAFNVLKKEGENKGSYGDSKLRIDGRFPDSGSVRVEIDPEMVKKGQEPIIMAETVYTLTEIGVDGVEFPGHYDGKMKREDVPFYAYTLTVPMWRALPPGNLEHAQVRMPDGELLSVSTFNERWKEGDDELQAALYAYLDDPQTFTVKRILKLLPDLDLDYAAEVISLLEHDAASVREDALDLLEEYRDEEEVLEAVLEMMENDDEEDLARSAALFLGEAESDQFNFHHDIYMLEHGEDEEALEAAAALGEREGDDRAVDTLYETLSDDRAEVAEEAADGLEALGATERQLQALEDDDIDEELRLAIAQMLREHSSADTRKTALKYVGDNTTARMAELAIRDLGEMDGEDVREDVESYLTAETRRKRLTAADVLVERGETDALEALASAVDAGKNPDEIEDAMYDLILDQPLSTVQDLSKSPNAVIERVAYSALGEKAQQENAGPDIFKTLAEGASNDKAAIRGASARALGVYADDDALEILEELTDDSSEKVRAGVAEGLSHYRDGQMKDKLIEYLDDPSPEVIAEAIRAMEVRGEDDEYNRFKDLTEHDSGRVRAAALSAISELVDRDEDDDVSNVISMLSGSVSDDDRQVKLTAIDKLATFKDQKAATGIAIQLNAEEPELRVAAIEALGKNGHQSATGLIMDVVDDANPDVRRAAVSAIRHLDDQSVKPDLKELLDNEEDPLIKDEIKETLQQL
ncbi:MAG: HEAT repeat domain-containing protein, partial [Persicimonas sp.]